MPWRPNPKPGSFYGGGRISFHGREYATRQRSWRQGSRENSGGMVVQELLQVSRPCVARSARPCLKPEFLFPFRSKGQTNRKRIQTNPFHADFIQVTTSCFAFTLALLFGGVVCPVGSSALPFVGEYAWLAASYGVWGLPGYLGLPWGRGLGECSSGRFALRWSRPAAALLARGSFV